jgi:hypothetical protein
VAPEKVEGLSYVDKQAAAIFELRNFPRYYNFTERMLAKLKRKWQAEKTEFSDVLVEEIDLTLNHIQQNK